MSSSTATLRTGPPVNYIWIGPAPKDAILQGQDVDGAKQMAEQNSHNPIRFWCLASEVQYYQAEFKNHAVEVHAVEELFVGANKDVPEVQQCKDIFDTCLNPDPAKGRNTIRDRTTVKNAVSVLILLLQGGYTLDSNIRPLQAGSVSLPDYKKFKYPKMKDRSGDYPEIWMMFSPQNNQSFMKKIFAELYNCWDHSEFLRKGISPEEYRDSVTRWLDVMATMTSEYQDEDYWIFKTIDDARIEELNLFKIYNNSHTQMMQDFKEQLSKLNDENLPSFIEFVGKLLPVYSEYLAKEIAMAADNHPLNLFNLTHNKKAWSELTYSFNYQFVRGHGSILKLITNAIDNISTNDQRISLSLGDRETSSLLLLENPTIFDAFVRGLQRNPQIVLFFLYRDEALSLAAFFQCALKNKQLGDRLTNVLLEEKAGEASLVDTILLLRWFKSKKLAATEFLNFSAAQQNRELNQKIANTFKTTPQSIIEMVETNPINIIYFVALAEGNVDIREMMLKQKDELHHVLCKMEAQTLAMLDETLVKPRESSPIGALNMNAERKASVENPADIRSILKADIRSLLKNDGKHTLGFTGA